MVVFVVVMKYPNFASFSAASLAGADQEVKEGFECGILVYEGFLA